MRYEHNYYITTDREYDFEFLFVDLGATGWRAYIISDINYQEVSSSRSDSCGVVHHLPENDEQMKNLVYDCVESIKGRTVRRGTLWYICWSTPVRTLEDMREVAKSWSEITAKYIKKGGDFSRIQQELNERGVIDF